MSRSIEERFPRTPRILDLTATENDVHGPFDLKQLPWKRFVIFVFRKEDSDTGNFELIPTQIHVVNGAMNQEAMRRFAVEFLATPLRQPRIRQCDFRDTPFDKSGKHGSLKLPSNFFEVPITGHQQHVVLAVFHQRLQALMYS